MDSDDPWCWDIDRVVLELCTDLRSWVPTFGTRRMPNPTLLEEALREQEIDGAILLSEVTELVIKNELGIKVFGQLAAIKQLIRDFRRRSEGYKIWKNNNGSELSLATHLPDGDFYTRKRSQSPCTENGIKRRRLDRTSIELKSEALSPPSTHGQRSISYSHDLHRDEPQTDAGGDDVEPDIDIAAITTPSVQDATHAETTIHIKERKRIAPTLITTVVDLDRDRVIPTQADMVIENDPHNIEPGVVYRGEDGRKRLMLLPHSETTIIELQRRHQEQLRKEVANDVHPLQLGGQRGLEAAEQILKAAEDKAAVETAEQPSKGYLGKRKYTVDDIFYPSTTIGNELQPPADGEGEECLMQVTRENILVGRRRYVQGLMKRYLRSKPRVLSLNGRSVLAHIPYAAELAPINQPPSFTLLQPTKDGGIRITRENLLEWPELQPHLHISKGKLFSFEDERQAQFHLPDNVRLGGLDTYRDWDPDLLEKYEYIDGGDAVLPLYGESDEEGEYDIETWNEIEEEHGELDKPLMKLRKRPLAEDEVNAAIDEGIAQIVIRWNKDKLPKCEVRAWKLWKMTRRDGNKRDLIQELQQHADRINSERLPKMRDEILNEVWTSTKQVHKQTRIMEQSIFDREELIFQISTLLKKNEPERPRRSVVTSHKPKTLSDNVEDDCENIDASDVESSHDELDDFIVDDNHDEFPEEGDHQRADDEAGDSDACDSKVSSEGASDPRQDRLYNAHIVGWGPIMRDLNEYPNTEAESMHESLRSSNEDKPTNGKVVLSPPSLPLRLAEERIVSEEDQWMELQEKATRYRGVTPEIIDLTQLTSDDTSNAINLVTPIKRKNKIKLIVKREPSPIPISDSEDIVLPELPSFTDLAAISKVTRDKWQGAGDRDRLLIWQLCHSNADVQADLQELFAEIIKSQMWSSMVDVMHAAQDGDARVPGMNEKTIFKYTRMFRLFEMYADCKYRGPRKVLPVAVVEKIKKGEKHFPLFYERCRQTLNILFGKAADWTPAQAEDSDCEPLSARRRKSKAPCGSTSASDAEDLELHALHKLRKKKIFENVQARGLREQDQQRLVEQEERRRILQQKLARSEGGLNADRTRVIINDAKHDDQGFIYVHEDIQARIKVHQIEGIRFMWSQIVTNEKLVQGCLLAHTMGLGKTMQVITLLVAIAQASRSPDESISSQIPQALRDSQTLVLCPPGLIDNWIDELLTWAPREILGDYRKVDSSMKMQARLDQIDSWNSGGGILVMGYEMFRKLVQNRATRHGAPLDEEEHATVLSQLLEKPNIIIADEAHKMKNASASVTQAAVRFKSRSRIALTGSPLANNVEEYHTMIEWVAPNYLGPIVEFRAKYVEPIEQGLWLDSTSYERRRSLTMLGVLKEDLSPKVHRADMSVLRDDLQPKTEFVIKVPLTELQEELYILYVRAMLGKTNSLTKDGQLHQTTLWHWLSILSLDCNHPECFRLKLSEHKEDVRKVIESKTSEEEPVPGATPVWKVGISEDLIRQVMDVFKKFGSPIDAVDNSNKVKLLLQILDASKAIGDKVLIFSHSIQTLNYLEGLCNRTYRLYARLDGTTKMNTRQALTKEFNTGLTEVYLISTRAGGLGLNLQGANRVVIFDFGFNPINEEQAVGRAYRIGQDKPVFVYRFVASGTFEESIHNKVVFKMQLASRVIDKKNPIAWAKRNIGEFLFEPKHVLQEDLSVFKGKDPHVLDKLLEFGSSGPNIRAIVMTDTFDRHDNDGLTAEEQKKVRQMVSDEKLKRSNPEAWKALESKRRIEDLAKQTAAAHVSRAQLPPAYQSYLAGGKVSAILSPQQNGQHTDNIRGSSVAAPSLQGDFPTENLSLSMMPEMTPIAGANTKVQPSTPPRKNATASTGGHHVANGVPSTLISNIEIDDHMADGLPRYSAIPGPPTSSVSTNDDESPLHSTHLLVGQDQAHSDIQGSFSVQKLLQVAIIKAEQKHKGDVSTSRASKREVEKAATSIREAMERNSPELLKSDAKDVARSLIDDPTIVERLLANTMTADSVIARIINKSPTRTTNLDESSETSRHTRTYNLQPEPTAVRKRSKYSREDAVRSPQAKADMAYLQRVAARRHSRVSDLKEQRKQDNTSPPRSQPQTPKKPASLPGWALEKLKEAHNGESSLHRRSSDRLSNSSNDN